MSNWRRTLYLMFTAQLLTAIGMSTVIPFLPNYVQALGARGGGNILFWVAAVYSVSGLTQMLASPFWGVVADRYGRKLMVQRALFGGAVVILLMGFARSAEEVVVLSAIQGLISGMVAAASSLVASQVPRSKVGFALGAIQTALWAGMSIGPFIGGGIEYLYGFRVTFIVTAVLLLLGGLLVTLWVREDFAAATSRPGRGLRGFAASWGHVVRARGVVPSYLLRFFARLSLAMLAPFLPLFVATIVADRELAGFTTGVAIGMASAAGTVSAIVLGRLGDRIGHRRILIVSASAAAVFYAPLSLVTATWQLLLLNTLVGAASGGLVPAISALLATYTDRGEEGSVFGLDNAAVAAARMVAPFLGGVIVAVSSSLFGVETFRALFVAASAVFLSMTLVALRFLPGREDVRARPVTGD